ncbi:MAG: hypothetical protein WDO69_33615 [Pseudomonadota bacterium]
MVEVSFQSFGVPFDVLLDGYTASAERFEISSTRAPKPPSPCSRLWDNACLHKLTTLDGTPVVQKAMATSRAKLPSGFEVHFNSAYGRVERLNRGVYAQAVDFPGSPEVAVKG